jgi:hypothetical protein
MEYEAMNWLSRLADHRDPRSWATGMRTRRFGFFMELTRTIPKPWRILDVGGRQEFWERMGLVGEPGVHITLLNLVAPQTHHDGFLGVAGDATNMAQFADREFNVVFSNSVIEHVGSHDRQRHMADEVRRVGERYFVQTPNFYFPIEPHTLVPGYHWLPLSARALLLTRFDLGWMHKVSDPHRAREVVQNIRLLKRRELAELFPGASVYEERVFGLVKSMVVYDGWPRPTGGTVVRGPKERDRLRLAPRRRPAK